MDRVDRPVLVGVGAALTLISAAWMGVGAFAVGLPGRGHPLSWVLAGLSWVLAGALLVSAVGIARRRESLRRFARYTLIVLVVLLTPIAVGPYLLLNLTALGAVFANPVVSRPGAESAQRGALSHPDSVSRRFGYKIDMPVSMKVTK